MFNKLHKKLTATTAMILICFLLVFSYSIVSIFSVAVDYSSQSSLQNQAAEIINVSKKLNTFDFLFYNDTNKDVSILRRVLDMHYIIWDSKRNIASLNFVNQDLIEYLFYQSKEVMENESVIRQNANIGGTHYRIYAQYYELDNGEGGVIQVIQSREVDLYILNKLFFIIMSIGLVSVVVLILISSYLAKKALQPVKESYEMQKEFVSDASHELRTPLTIIRTNLELLSMKEDETIRENKKWFDNIYTETETMSKLVHDLLELAKLDNKQAMLKFETINLSEITNEISDKMSLIAQEKNIGFKFIVSDEVFIKGDSSLIRRLLLIIIDNAVKYTPSGGKVLVSLMSTDSKAILSVKDTGIGLSDEDKEKIFERFYRVDKVRSRKQGGVGLGLSIAKWIIDEHKASIKVNSKLGEGSEFIIEFNLSK